MESAAVSASPVQHTRRRVLALLLQVTLLESPKRPPHLRWELAERACKGCFTDASDLARLP